MSTILHYAVARLATWGRTRQARPAPNLARFESSPGVSVVIPSRNGRDLLAAQLPGIVGDLAAVESEVIVVDNGSDDGTVAWLSAEWPDIRIEISHAALSFSQAVNRGIALASYSHVCLLNNDMILEPGFFAALQEAFSAIPDLFCATAQIFFPPGARREETGKAVMAQDSPADFPIRCDEPIPGEDHTYVLYGSGGCSLYDTAMLRRLGALDEAYNPAYVEDLDLGWRAWQRGWPTVYVAGARVEHRHRATTSRYFTEAQLEAILEINYLKFLARAVASPPFFRTLWRRALQRLRLLADRDAARQALRQAASIVWNNGPAGQAVESEEAFVALTDGSNAVFRGAGKGVLVEEAEHLEQPKPDVLAAYSKVLLVRPGRPRAFDLAERLAAEDSK